MAALPASLRPWSDLPLELLGHVIARLPFPADRARLRAVCRDWRDAARHHLRCQLPWLVLPDLSFCTIDGDGSGIFFPRGTIPGVPKDATCVGSTDGWLTLDRTDDAFARMKFIDKWHSATYKDYPHLGVNHRHSYLLHNPFSGETVPLPELDAIIGHVSESFEVRNVIMRSSSPNDIIAIVTNSKHCNVILCHPGKGTYILDHFRVCGVAFFEDWLYGITQDEDLLAFRLDQDDDGKPIVVHGKRIIKHPLPEGKVDLWSWMEDADDGGNDDDQGDSVNGDNGDGDINEDEAPNQEMEDRFHEDVMSDDEDIGSYTEEPHKGHATTTRNFVVSRRGELLMVRYVVQEPPFTSSYIREVEVFKADMDMGKWIPVGQNILAQDEVLFLSRAFCKSSHVSADMEPGFIYFDSTNEVFDTISWTPMPFRMPWQRKEFTKKWITWFFPPEVVV
ncbi:unnamed protein product [Urochloa humidicola]